MRTQTPTMTNILEAFEMTETLDIYLANGTVKRFSRGAATRNGNTYEDSLIAVGDISQSVETDVDILKVEIQNYDGIFGHEVSANWRQLIYAYGEYGEIWKSTRDGAIADYPQEFRGLLSKVEVKENVCSLEFADTLEALGETVGNRMLSPLCQTAYKNQIECNATGTQTSCPKTRAACLERHNATIKDAEFMGWLFFEEATQTLPGAGGNDGGGVGGGQLPCFTGRTNIKTPVRDFTFEEIKTRFDLGLTSIYSFNEKTGAIEPDEIEQVFVHKARGILTLVFEHGTVETTLEHPFWTGAEWKPAETLQVPDDVTPGDRVKTFGGGLSELKEIHWQPNRVETVYNCRVKRNRTYFANDCAVHNTKLETNTD